jgi:hypothetical protein
VPIWNAQYGPGAFLEDLNRSTRQRRLGLRDRVDRDHAEEIMKEAKKLHEEYQKKLKHLQQTCPHEKQSDWMEEWWAPGHSTGRMVKVCSNCNKVLQAKRPCHDCRKECPEKDLRAGDGHILPYGAYYCEACHASALKKAKAKK